MRNILFSVVVPTFNESNNIVSCLQSLLHQSVAQNTEVLVVDDKSSDSTENLLLSFKRKSGLIKIFRTKHHSGPGVARNIGAAHAKGVILVFVDADMTFDQKFIEKLTRPILKGKAIGSDSDNELLKNKDNYWAKCWNIGRFNAAGVYTSRVNDFVAPKTSISGTIFRAIRKDVFDKAGGFDSSGDYADDESLFKKVSGRALIVSDAIFYHKNPDTIREVVSRAWWIGSSQNFIGSFKQKLIGLIKFNFLFSLLKGVIIGLRFSFPKFVFFKIVYDTTVWLAISYSFLFRAKTRTS